MILVLLLVPEEHKGEDEEQSVEQVDREETDDQGCEERQVTVVAEHQVVDLGEDREAFEV